MKNIFLFLILILSFQLINAQGVFAPDNYNPCCDSTGKPLNPNDPSNQVFALKSFPVKTSLEIKIKSMVITSTTVNVNFQYKGMIDGETRLLHINDSIGIKLVVGRTTENNIKKYVYKYMIFKKDKKSNCWNPLTLFNSYNDVPFQTVSWNLTSIGNQDSRDYVQIIEGSVKFD